MLLYPAIYMTMGISMLAALPGAILLQALIGPPPRAASKKGRSDGVR